MLKKYSNLIYLNLVATLMTLSGYAFSANDIVIDIHEEQCVVTVSGNSNCDAGQCADDSQCVCASKGDHIVWVANNDDPFDLDFGAESPLKKNCGKHAKAGQQKCVVKTDLTTGDEFVYDIRFKKCDQPADPKIIIK